MCAVKMPGAARLWPVRAAERACVLLRHEAVGDDTCSVPHTSQRREIDLHRGKGSAILGWLRSVARAYEHGSRPARAELLRSVYNEMAAARNEDEMRPTARFREPSRCE